MTGRRLAATCIGLLAFDGNFATVLIIIENDLF